MTPLNYNSLKTASRQLLEPYRRTAGLTAVCVVLVMNILNLALSMVADRMFPLPDFQTTDELIKYFLDGHTNELIALTVCNLLTLAVSLLIVSLFSAYTLHIAQGQSAGGRAFLSTLRLLPRYLLLGVLLAVVLFGAGFLISLAVSFLYPLASLLVIVAAVIMLIVFYLFRLSLYAIADRPDCHILTAMRDCAKISKGHRMELFFFDIGFLWFTILTVFITTVCAMIPDAIAAVGTKAGNDALVSWVQTNLGILDPVCSLLGTVVALPLCYKFYTSINLTFALAYQQLKLQTPKQADTQPLAYQEFDDPE